jgi:beta-glucosidase
MRNFLIFLIFLSSACNHLDQPKYKNASIPVDERVNDLVKRMTLEEKVAQLYGCFINDSLGWDEKGNYIGKKAEERLKLGVGSFWALDFKKSLSWRAKCINGVQKYLVEKSRFGIPAFVFGESLHGFMSKGATSFPQAIALGSTWDTTLVEQVFSAAAIEARSSGTNQVLSPVLDLARDPRWGRSEECYGEDRYLVSRVGLAAVYGLQGRDKLIDNKHVAVTLKHFAGHGQPEGGRNIAPVNYSEREFRENHLYPFEMVVKKANAQSIMASYNEWDGVPNHVNYKLLTEILKNEWGFKGYVMSDGGGMDVLYNEHHAATDSADAGKLSIEAGLDYDLSSHGCFKSLTEQVKQGKVKEEFIDKALRNVLRVKFTLGLFEHPYIDVDYLEKIINCKEHKALALRAAQEAMVLLKNEKNTLPFDSIKIKTLAVIGPNAAEIHLGGYSNPPMKGTSVLEGIKKFAENRFKVLYAEGCKLTLNKECHWKVEENPILNEPEKDKKLISEAVRVAKQSDAVILVLGENELICREAWDTAHLGDRDNLDLVGMQNELAKAIIETGKPVVVLLLNGRAISINYLKKHAPAIIEGWYLGQETGTAVADVIFGKVNPSGRLTVTFPKSVGQLPCFYNHKPSRYREYVLAENKPLFPFGFGLSYSNYEYKNLKIEPKETNASGNIKVTVDVTNLGKMKGDEIVQLYIHELVSLPVKPVKQLIDFARVPLKAGESKTVAFNITPDKLESFGLDMKRSIQPGEFEVMVGKNSEDVIIEKFIMK